MSQLDAEIASVTEKLITQKSLIRRMEVDRLGLNLLAKAANRSGLGRSAHAAAADKLSAHDDLLCVATAELEDLGKQLTGLMAKLATTLSAKPAATGALSSQQRATAPPISTWGAPVPIAKSPAAAAKPSALSFDGISEMALAFAKSAASMSPSVGVVRRAATLAEIKNFNPELAAALSKDHAASWGGTLAVWSAAREPRAQSAMI
jgi:hypothetical protein